ncbi:MAG: Hsp20 family protein [Pseudomonadota bacterium]
MARMSVLSNPLLLGFEEIERLIERAGKSSGEGYPPYNIERIAKSNVAPELLRITLAVAGFSRDELEITVEDNQLVVRGQQDRQEQTPQRTYIYRGIAMRKFQRIFVLAEGIEVKSADLENGLLSIDLIRFQPERSAQRIEIGAASQ